MVKVYDSYILLYLWWCLHNVWDRLLIKYIWLLTLESKKQRSLWHVYFIYKVQKKVSVSDVFWNMWDTDPWRNIMHN